MKIPTRVRWVTGIVVIGAAACALTWSVRARSLGPAGPVAQGPAGRDPVLNWLEVPAADREEVVRHDPDFEQDLARMRSDLQARRTDLADLLEKPDTPAGALRDKVEAVIAANAALQRRVMEHVLAVREHLSGAQQRRLLDLCAQGVREGSQWRGGRGPGWARGGGGAGPGRGAGRGGGAGGGGRGFRGGRGPATTKPGTGPVRGERG